MSWPPEVNGPRAASDSVPHKLPWQDALLLDEGETISSYWRGNHAVNEMGTVNGRSEQVEVRKPGVLVLTSRKVVFLEERGLFNKSYHLDLGIQLESIEGISMGGLLMKYVSIGGTMGENKFHLEGIDDKVFGTFKQVVLSQIEQRKEELEKEKANDSVELILDFSLLRDYMTKGGISVQAVKCPECKAPLALPENGNVVKCSFCGSTIYASDIMDRVKQLIG